MSGVYRLHHQNNQVSPVSCFLPAVQLIRLDKHLNGQAQQFRELSDHINGERFFTVEYKACGGLASNGRY